MHDARMYHTVAGTFQMRTGKIQTPTFAYETWGELNSTKSNAILILTGLSASAHVASNEQDPSAGWWEDMVGPHKPIDTTRYFVICVNSLGSCFGSTGPGSTDPATGQLYRLSFPLLHLEDIARSANAVVTWLGIEQLHSVIGASMGGMTALSYVAEFPLGARSLVLISAASSSEPFAIAIRSLQRELIRADPNWQDGNYASSSPPVRGMALARKLGMISYRSSEEWIGRFGRERVSNCNDFSHMDDFGIDFEVESYLDAHGTKFAASFDANCYLYLSRAMDLFDLADHGGSINSALQNASLARILVLGVKSDFLFPPRQQQHLADDLKAGSFEVDFEILESIQGHDSFLIDMDRFRPRIAEFYTDISTLCT